MGADLPRLMKASLLARSEVKELLLSHPDLDLLISKLESKNIKGILSQNIILDISEEINKEKLQINIGRTIAPINPRKIAPASRPPGLEHYDVSLFDTNANEIDNDIEILFEITEIVLPKVEKKISIHFLIIDSKELVQ